MNEKARRELEQELRGMTEEELTQWIRALKAEPLERALRSLYETTQLSVREWNEYGSAFSSTDAIEVMGHISRLEAALKRAVGVVNALEIDVWSEYSASDSAYVWTEEDFLHE